jgi:5'-3' exonuclease
LNYEFNLVFINILREYIYLEFEDSNPEIFMADSEGDEFIVFNIIDDLILIFNFFGNDFLPAVFDYDFRGEKFYSVFQNYKSFLKISEGFI